MLEIEYTNQFKKDLKNCKKQGKNLTLIEKLVELLINQKAIPTKHKDHKLIGSWDGFRELHLDPDWLLIYQICQKSHTLILIRTGSHARLF
jgi:mRNA interferase YafQ